MTELQALELVDFEWVVHVGDVWRAPAADVPGLHANLRAEFARKLNAMEQGGGEGSPLGWVVAGSGGTGKTHLLGAFRRETTRRGLPFILVDMTDVHDFWECVLRGYLDSLQQIVDDGAPQYKRILGNVIDRLSPNKPVANVLAALADRKSRDLRRDADKVLQALNRTAPRETSRYQNVIRALICLNSDDFTLSSLGQTWLQGLEVEDEQRRELGFTAPGEQPFRIVEALSWALSLSGPTVLALDQLDASIGELHNRKFGAEATATARAILDRIGGGLGALRDATRNTLTVISCLETTWSHLRGVILGTAIDRFEPPRRLKVEHDADIARALVAGRLAAAHRASGFTPTHPTFPFHPEAFADLHGSTPREILKHCKAHIQQCLESQHVFELLKFAPGPLPEPKLDANANDDALARIDDEFQRLKAEADPAWLLEEKRDDERLAPLILAGLKRLIDENDLGPNATPQLDAELTGGTKTRPLHARLRLIFHNDNEREEHFCVRAIQWSNAIALQSRLKAALTLSGIDRGLKFRRLTIVRSLSNPNGKATTELIERFTNHGGAFVIPAEAELRTLHALHQFNNRKDADFLKWLKNRRPASSLSLIQTIVGNHPLFSGAPTTNGVTVIPPIGPAHPPTPPPPTTTPADAAIPLGRRLQNGKPGETVQLPIKLLDKHALILAGSGSGKTVLLKRLIEEAALAGVPSIVVDHANDLAALGDRWAEPPDSWTDDDRRKASAYRVPGRVVVWTPGKTAGNPLSLEPVPDLSPLAGDAEELENAAAMAVATLAPQAAPGSSKTNHQKLAILKTAIIYLAKHGGGRLGELIGLLSDLPPEAGCGINNEARLARDMADGLKAAIVMDPLLRSSGTPIDPTILFGLDRGSAAPARVSVVSLVGLPSLEARRHFVNQLAMTLFTWIRKNPDRGDRPLRGLLVIDEAKDFIPSQKASACAESLRLLGAQARKYGLGLVFATQNPKDIDNKLVANCSTHFYGRMNSPAAIEAARDMIRGKGGSGDDLSNLPAGHFHFHNPDAGLPRPIKILTSICLSRHPPNPLDEPAILARAASSRVAT